MTGEINGRNSPLRLLLKYPVDSIVTALDKLGITANELTVLGLLGNVAASIIVSKEQHKPKKERLNWIISTLILLLPKLFDLLDGSLARKQGTNNPLLDVVSDRVSESIAKLSIMIHTPSARDTAFASLITAPLPSLSKAYAESNRHIVPELSLGSYPVRVGLTTAALVLPEHANTLLLAETVANTVTASRRLLSNTTDGDLSLEATQKSGERFKILLGITVVTITAGLVTGSLLKSKT